MKRLLLPLLVVLALPTAVNADLGSADFPDVRTVFPIKKGKSKTIDIQNEKLNQSLSNKFKLNCGWFFNRDFQECKIEFKDGRLIVDNSFGIKPNQIKDIQELINSNNLNRDNKEMEGMQNDNNTPFM